MQNAEFFQWNFQMQIPEYRPCELRLNYYLKIRISDLKEFPKFNFLQYINFCK
jgi:hypothetical protein